MTDWPKGWIPHPGRLALAAITEEGRKAREAFEAGQADGAETRERLGEILKDETRVAEVDIPALEEALSWIERKRAALYG